jgi:hypothetical protein
MHAITASGSIRRFIADSHGSQGRVLLLAQTEEKLVVAYYNGYVVCCIDLSILLFYGGDRWLYISRSDILSVILSAVFTSRPTTHAGLFTRSVTRSMYSSRSFGNGAEGSYGTLVMVR